MTVPAKHIEWLRLANSGDYFEKKGWFYPFKSRFCHTYGVADGQDLQTITRKCYCGDGIWRGCDDHLPKEHWRVCDKCSGTGIYLKKNILLIRWLVGGYLFHEPSPFVYIEGRDPVKERFDGLIKHDPVDASVARRCMERLMLRYEPETLKALYVARARDWAYWKKVGLRSHFRRLNERLRAAFGKPVSDELPF